MSHEAGVVSHAVHLQTTEICKYSPTESICQAIITIQEFMNTEHFLGMYIQFWWAMLLGCTFEKVFIKTEKN